MAGLTKATPEEATSDENLAKSRAQASVRHSVRRWFSVAIATTLTVLLLHWSFRDLHWAIVWKNLRQAQPAWLAFGLGAYLLSCGLRAWRWGLLLRAQSHAGSLRQRTAALFVGYAGNSFLPFSAGEVVRAGLLHRWAKVPFQPALGSIVAERLMDIWVVFFLLLICVNQTLAQSGTVSLPLGWMASGVGLVSAGIWLATRYPRAIAQPMGQLLSFLLRPLGLNRWGQVCANTLVNLLQGLQVLQQPQRFLAVFALSCVTWLTNGLLYWATLKALQIPEPGYSGALLAQSLTAFAMVLPASPGYIGPFEAAIRVALDWFSVSGDLTMAYALMLRVLMYLVTPMIGLAIAIRLGVSGAELCGKPSRKVRQS